MTERDKLRTRIVDEKKQSFDWLEANFFGEWEQTWKNYKTIRDPVKDLDGKEDPDLSAVGMPDTWGYCRRMVARGTAQLPNLRYHARDTEVGDLISRTLMYQWDRGKAQRIQKKHFLQALLFGWSVKAWYWANEERVRTRRIDLENLTQEDLKAISDTYRIPPQYLQDQNLLDRVLQRLLAKHGRGGLLPVKEVAKSYEGPKSDFLFIGDCYPQPNFQTLQSSAWFLVERRRKKDWLMALGQAYPDLQEGVNELFKNHPQGTPPPTFSSDHTTLRKRLESLTQKRDIENWEDLHAPEWTIVEEHRPGESGSIAYLANDDIALGKISYPSDLDGQIAFSECVLIDDLLTGIGDSTARIMRGLQQLHERQVNRRQDLIYNVLRPLLGTTNRELIENPGLIKRGAGFRLVYMRGPGDLWTQGEQAAIAAAAAGLQDESGLMRLYQMLTGESNMSMAANVDPQQNRTATGARILAFNQDVLTKDLNDMFANTALTSDAEIMYLLDRSELTEDQEFEGSKYNRRYSTEEDAMREKWVRIKPLHFQVDGEIVAEIGSTLADDDDTNVTKIQSIGAIGFQRPDLFNQQKLRDEYLIAMGKGRDLQAWAAPPPPPPPPAEIKTTMTVSAKWIELTNEERAAILQRASIQVNTDAPEPPPTLPGAPNAAPEEEPLLAAQAEAAARGQAEMPAGGVQ